jgi:hypothetical protein
MFVAGVLLSASAVALLARRLQEAGELDMAETIGYAVDRNQEELLLGPHEGRAILAALHHCPPDLEPLKLTLRARA